MLGGNRMAATTNVQFRPIKVTNTDNIDIWVGQVPVSISSTGTWLWYKCNFGRTLGAGKMRHVFIGVRHKSNVSSVNYKVGTLTDTYVEVGINTTGGGNHIIDVLVIVNNNVDYE